MQSILHAQYIALFLNLDLLNVRKKIAGLDLKKKCCKLCKLFIYNMNYKIEKLLKNNIYRSIEPM